MKKLMVVLFLLFILFSGYSQNASFVQKIQDKGFITVGMIAKDQYPFFYENEKQELVGLDVDIAKKLAKDLNVELRIDRSSTSFNNLIPAILSKKIDVAISKLSRTIQRSQKVLFSNPYIVFNQAFLFNQVQLARAISNDNQLRILLQGFNGRLGVIKNSSYERYAKVNFPRADVVPFDSWEKAIKGVLSGDVISIYRDEMEVTKVIVDDPSKNLFLKPVVIEDYKDPIAIALPLHAIHFMLFINLVLDSMDIPQNSKDLLKHYDAVKKTE